MHASLQRRRFVWHWIVPFAHKFGQRQRCLAFMYARLATLGHCCATGQQPLRMRSDMEFPGGHHDCTLGHRPA
eukprot:2384431-Amphidinium_carterae.2